MSNVINLAEYRQQRQETALQRATRECMRTHCGFLECARRYNVDPEELVTAIGAIITRKREAQERGGSL